MKNRLGKVLIFILISALLATWLFLYNLMKVDDIRLIDTSFEKSNKSEAILTQELSNSSNNYRGLIDEKLNSVDVNTLTTYEIDANFDDVNMTIEALQNVRYTNNEEDSLKTIQFHVFSNAFMKKETSPTTLSNFSYAYPNGFSPGYTEFDYIRVNGENIEYEVSGLDSTKLTIYLTDFLEPDESIDIQMSYKLKLPNCRDRFGYDEYTIQIANWYPMLSVYEDSGWYENPYYNIGDPFYSETSLYDISLSVPIEYIAASTGLKEDIILQEDVKTYKISSDLTRDFAIVLSKYFSLDTKIVDGTRISTYTYTDDGDDINEALESGERSLIAFNQLFGKYPYTDLAIVETSFPSGMEYPGLIMIGNNYYLDGSEVRLDHVVNHEIGHQWWYSLVGNDQIRYSWLDEGLTSYSEILYSEFFDEGEYNKQANNVRKSVSNGLKSYNKIPVDSSLDKFQNWDDYGFLVYRKSQMFFIEYREAYGKDKLLEALRLHFEKNKYKVSSTEDIINTFEEVAGEDISYITNSYLFDYQD